MGTVYQDPVGTDRAPNSALYSLSPSPEFDTFVTIGEPGPFSDSTFLSPWPGFTDDFLGGTNIGWHRLISDPQAWAVNGRQDLGGYGVLIGKFTHVWETFSDIVGIRFEALISYDVIGGGAAQSTYVSQWFIVLPGPGGAALLIGAGLTTLKRRRRRLVN